MKSTIAALAGAVVLSTLSVMAAPAATLTCSVGDVTYSLFDAVDSYCTTGNDSGTSLDVFGETYTLGDKVGDESAGDGTVFFTDAPTAGEPSPGTWAVSGMFDSLVIVLKQANSFAAFLIADGVTNGTWTTSGPGASTMDLSHGSAWYTPGDMSPIPVPAALPLVVSALGGLLLFRRKRHSA